MTIMAFAPDGLRTLAGAMSLNPAPRLERFRREQAARDRAIQIDLTKRLYLASALERLRTQSSNS
ncbi:MAG: hypothetical protein LBH76_03830 [Propionibacteriaceae bacterium]|jgi:hypothetical protein|nr:hypothetical protein [Propionibacteriaceae bacterium]